MALMVAKYEKADQFFTEVLSKDPADQAALYYRDLIRKKSGR